ncbi:phosphate transporter [Paraphysoderma sedebokerense]|nr:phosphate transporter [Paraphysoderma sedebokerense]
MQPHDYLWLTVIGFIVAFADAFGIGANDVANSFATSVGSRSLTLKQACLIAVFTEFLGAFLLGAGTSEAVRGIVNATVFAKQPELLMLAMVCALIGSAVWTIFASSKGWPVSTTHSIVGAIAGTVLVAFGGDALKWGYSDKGVAFIVTSWIISPVVSGLVAASIFLSTKYLILLSGNSYERAKKAIPVYFFITFAINIFYIVFKSGKTSKSIDLGVVFGSSFGASALVGLWAYFFYRPWIARQIENGEDLRVWHLLYVPWVGPRPQRTNTASSSTISNDEEIDLEKKVVDEEAPVVVEEPKKKSLFGKFKAAATKGVNVDVVNFDAEDLKEVHDAAPRYDSRTEQLYSFLQVFTAMCASFAHGSNDVANAVGPLSTIWFIYENGDWPESANKVPVPIWILAYGGLAIDIGLITYGYHVMRSLGNHITYHSPTRGFSMELGTSLTVLTASKIGIPVSTTHCLVGATAAVGLCNGTTKALHWRTLFTAFFSWILTLPAAGGLAGAIYAFAIYSPNK